MTLPLEVLQFEAMASGHRSLRLTRRVAWEDFGPYADAIVSALDATVLDRVDSPIERIWRVRIGAGQYWLGLDDFGLGVSLDSCDAAADAQIEGVRERLLALPGSP